MTLSDIETRILGALIEKERTTPDNYPLSLNALTTACNQISNREPVMSLDEDRVKWAVNNLRQQSLVRAIQPADSRVMKFQHLASDKLNLGDRELAVLCVLMLRGPQTMAELKTRTARLADFATMTDVDDAVRSLIARDFATELPRRPGQKETRIAQLLSGPPAVPAAGEDSDVLSDPGSPTHAASANDDRVAALESTVDDLRRELSELRGAFEDFRRQFS